MSVLRSVWKMTEGKTENDFADSINAALSVFFFSIHKNSKNLFKPTCLHKCQMRGEKAQWAFVLRKSASEDSWKSLNLVLLQSMTD